MQKILTIEKINETFFRLSCNEYTELRKIYDYFKVMIDNAKFSPRYKSGIWDGKISPFDLRTQTIPIGLWKELLEYCNKNDIKYAFIGMQPSELFKDDKYTLPFINMYTEKVIEENLPFILRENQKMAVYYAMQFKKCVLLLATGFGKSIVIYELIRLLYSTKEADRILLVVPNINLVNQMRANFLDDYNWEECDDNCYLLCNDTKPKIKAAIAQNMIDKPILITTWQSIIRKPDPWFKQWDALIVDEVHGVTNSGKSLQGISKKCTEARYKIGLTGTLGESDIDKQTTIGYIGPVAYIVKSKELIESDVLSRIEIKNLIIRYNDEVSLQGLGKDYHTETELIESIPERMTVIKDIFDKIEEGQNTLILAKHIKHMKDITEYLKQTLDSKYTIKMVYGSVQGDVREQIRVDMSNGHNYVLVASFAIAGTGWNIPAIHHLIFAASYKAKIKVLQSCGRGLRKAKDKLKVCLWDIVDDFSEKQKTGRRIHKNHSYKHYEKRKSFYDEEGFPNEDIDVQL